MADDNKKPDMHAVAWRSGNQSGIVEGMGAALTVVLVESIRSDKAAGKAASRIIREMVRRFGDEGYREAFMRVKDQPLADQSVIHTLEELK